MRFVLALVVRSVVVGAIVGALTATEVWSIDRMATDDRAYLPIAVAFVMLLIGGGIPLAWGLWDGWRAKETLQPVALWVGVAVLVGLASAAALVGSGTEYVGTVVIAVLALAGLLVGLPGVLGAGVGLIITAIRESSRAREAGPPRDA